MQPHVILTQITPSALQDHFKHRQCAENEKACVEIFMIITISVLQLRNEAY